MAAPAKRRSWRAASVWALYAAGFVPAVWYFYLGATGQIAGNAVKEFEHLLGIWALRWLVATLAVTLAWGSGRAEARPAPSSEHTQSQATGERCATPMHGGARHPPRSRAGVQGCTAVCRAVQHI